MKSKIPDPTAGDHLLEVGFLRLEEEMDPLLEAVERLVADETSYAELMIRFPLVMSKAAFDNLRLAVDYKNMEYLFKHCEFLVSEIERFVWEQAQIDQQNL